MLPTASGLTRALRCPASCRLPQATREAGAPALTGTQVHTFLETVYQQGREGALQAVTDERAYRICAALDWLGVALDEDANARNASVISAAASRVRVGVEPTNEEWVAARHAQEVLALG